MQPWLFANSKDIEQKTQVVFWLVHQAEVTVVLYPGWSLCVCVWVGVTNKDCYSTYAAYGPGYT